MLTRIFRIEGGESPRKKKKNFPLILVTVLQTTAQLEINISNRSHMTNATYQTGAQSKISIKKYNPLPTTPWEHVDASS